MNVESIWGDEAPELINEVNSLTTEGIMMRTSAIEAEVRTIKADLMNLNRVMSGHASQTKDNNDKIQLHKQLPYLVANVVESLELEDETGEESGAATDVDMQRTGKSMVIKTSTRQTIFLPVIGLVPADELRPNDLVGVNKDTYLVLDKLPPEYDSRVKAMEVDEKPTEDYSDIGGLDKQIQELVEAIVLPMTHKERFDAIGIKPPKGVLLHGPPGRGRLSWREPALQRRRRRFSSWRGRSSCRCSSATAPRW
eukprot:GHVU01026812.1.p1 GENE.GHVU01026812.1~~GHVU01026812.1.p1  ORF type:complete len:253 (+),score=51.42 GHVU01026812.1:277-1035(+)